MELTIAPQNDDFDGVDRADPRWQQQVSAFYRDLQQNVGDARTEQTPVEGGKGPATEIILALGSSGAIGAAVTMFKAWLDRDRERRSIELTYDAGGKKRTLTVRADGVDEAFDEIAREAAREFHASG
jgi:hypothetical protein